jgi:hypothetical protein
MGHQQPALRGISVDFLVNACNGIADENIRCGSNSVVECQLPKLNVASSNLVSRSTFLRFKSFCINHLRADLQIPRFCDPS